MIQGCRVRPTSGQAPPRSDQKRHSRTTPGPCLDPWYIANSLARDFLPTPSLPTIVASAGDIEMLAAIGQRRSVSKILRQITQTGDERQTWELGVAIQDYSEPTDRNPLLQQAFDRLPFGNTEADQAA